MSDFWNNQIETLLDKWITYFPSTLGKCPDDSMKKDKNGCYVPPDEYSSNLVLDSDKVQTWISKHPKNLHKACKKVIDLLQIVTLEDMKKDLSDGLHQIADRFLNGDRKNTIHIWTDDGPKSMWWIRYILRDDFKKLFAMPKFNDYLFVQDNWDFKSNGNVKSNFIENGTEDINIMVMDDGSYSGNRMIDMVKKVITPILDNRYKHLLNNSKKTHGKEVSAEDMKDLVYYIDLRNDNIDVSSYVDLCKDIFKDTYEEEESDSEEEEEEEEEEEDAEPEEIKRGESAVFVFEIESDHDEIYITRDERMRDIVCVMFTRIGEQTAFSDTILSEMFTLQVPSYEKFQDSKLKLMKHISKMAFNLNISDFTTKRIDTTKFSGVYGSGNITELLFSRDSFVPLAKSVDVHISTSFMSERGKLHIQDFLETNVPGSTVTFYSNRIVNSVYDLLESDPDKEDMLNVLGYHRMTIPVEFKKKHVPFIFQHKIADMTSIGPYNSILTLGSVLYGNGTPKYIGNLVSGCKDIYIGDADIEMLTILIGRQRLPNDIGDNCPVPPYKSLYRLGVDGIERVYNTDVNFRTLLKERVKGSDDDEVFPTSSFQMHDDLGSIKISQLSNETIDNMVLLYNNKSNHLIRPRNIEDRILTGEIIRNRIKDDPSKLDMIRFLN